MNYNSFYLKYKNTIYIIDDCYKFIFLLLNIQIKLILFNYGFQQ